MFRISARVALALPSNGLENRVKRKVDLVFQKVIKEIKIETLKNINDLKEQISLKELEIKNIRSAKSEFSYHFAQSLLKTINTLNLEVLDLKQRDLDDEFKFAGNLDPNVLERIYQQYLKEMEQINQYDVRVVRKETTRSVQG